NPLGDVTVLVTQLEEIYGPNREWRLLQFIDNVASSIPNTELQTNLLSIRVQLQTTGRPSKLNPAETAQVHMFDLRQPVMMCVGQLPRDGGVSGFVVPGATPMLLKNFCESLRHRGEQYAAWTRDRVVQPYAPKVIGPSALETPVSVAI